ncbi:hypothetical protein C922_03288 [Plasmodium inui San Antonio 1]|uniref:Uncharacterized protein n=1 Tax=Plasmodium inui San Antonio 1 TaxID=1237626 RepID=W6ZZL8_9APIC|nr:hypothetical protein C922_03288 [Plasmodium inui San Antonio 1]EUD66372.1 hypothetical protein C922_03288 [Plasmodium inui San Antonio 1]
MPCNIHGVIIEVNCLSENHSNILYKCLSSDESLKQNEMYKRVNISGSLIKM